MWIDASTLQPNQTVESDLCIVGSGAAGLALLQEFLPTTQNITIIESGGFEPESETQNLYRGYLESNIIDNSHPYLTSSRLRYFGGTTNHWAGWCRPLDSIDFEARPEVPHSGWPFSKEHLLPYYLRASKFLGLQGFDPVESEPAKARRLLFEKESDRLETKFFQFSPHTFETKRKLFGRIYRTSTEISPNIHAYLNTNLLEIEVNKQASFVERLRCGTLVGLRFYVRAKAYVLACGGIENARLLLASKSTSAQGLGNEDDNVGRFFMDHPHIPNAAQVLLLGAPKVLKLYGRHKTPLLTDRIAVITPTERSMRDKKLSNFCVHLYVQNLRDTFENPLNNGLVEALQLQNTLMGGNQTNIAGSKACLIPALIRLEQYPNPDSRVILNSERDSLGMPRVTLNWKLGGADLENYGKIVRLLASELGRKALGRLAVNIEEIVKGGPSYGGAHHMGTTRMSKNKKDGVVDPNSKVHSIENLYVAGSSVFPTGGFANPTFTIIALTIRLADTLKKLLGK